MFPIVIFLTAAAIPLIAQQPTSLLDNLKELKLLVSTPSEVVRLLGAPEPAGNNEYTRRYQLSYGIATAEYSRGFCSSVKNGEWDVEEFTLTGIFFEPNKSFTPKQLGFKLESFTRHEVKDVPGAFYYQNEKVGINFTLKRNGKVESIALYPPAQQDPLSCKKS